MVWEVMSDPDEAIKVSVHSRVIFHAAPWTDLAFRYYRLNLTGHEPVHTELWFARPDEQHAVSAPNPAERRTSKRRRELRQHSQPVAARGPAAPSGRADAAAVGYDSGTAETTGVPGEESVLDQGCNEFGHVIHGCSKLFVVIRVWVTSGGAGMSLRLVFYLYLYGGWLTDLESL